MIAALLLYCFLASLLLGVVGYLFERFARLLSLPARISWAGALVLLLLLAVSAPIRAPADVPVLLEGIPDVADLETAAANGRMGAVTILPGVGMGRVLDEAFRWVAPLGQGGRGLVLAGVWGALSALVLGIGLTVLYRSWRRRLRWPRAVLAGEAVRIAPRDGPAVVGLLRPEILVPRWLVEAPEERQHMAIQHEREHIRAGDPYLLGFAGLMTVALPWNPVIWWMCARLRLAIELDCDRRVLCRGVHPRAYGSFLIDTAALGLDRLQGAVTLVPPTSTLSRRIQAMTNPKPRHAVIRAAVVAVLGGVALAAACEARLPTQAEVDEMDVAAAEMKLQGLLSVGEATDVTYFVDGVQVTPAEAKAVAARDIGRIEVARGPAGERLAIVTKVAEAGPDAQVPVPIEVGEPQGTLRAITESQHTLQKVQAFQGLVVIDGEVAAPGQLQTLRPGAIELVEVIKGKAAQRLYPQLEAAKGVIRITTKRLP